MANLAELSESELYTILEEKDAENTKKQLKLLKTYFEATCKKKVEGSRAFDIKS